MRCCFALLPLLERSPSDILEVFLIKHSLVKDVDVLLLAQLPLLERSSGDILEVFLIKHSLVANQLGRFSFASKVRADIAKRSQDDEELEKCA